MLKKLILTSTKIFIMFVFMGTVFPSCKPRPSDTSEEKDNFMTDLGYTQAAPKESCNCSCTAKNGRNYSGSEFGNENDLDHLVKKCGIALINLRSKFINKEFYYDLTPIDASACLESAVCQGIAASRQMPLNLAQTDIQGVLKARIVYEAPNKNYLKNLGLDPASKDVTYDPALGLLVTSSSSLWYGLTFDGRIDGNGTRRIITQALADWEKQKAK